MATLASKLINATDDSPEAEQARQERKAKRAQRQAQRGMSKEDLALLFAQQGQQAMDMQQQANQQQSDMFDKLKLAGQLGGIRESSRNVGSGDVSGLQYLDKYSNKRSDGFVNPNIQAAGQAGVAQAAQKQADDRAYAGLALQARGTLDTGDGVNFYNNPAAAKAQYDVYDPRDPFKVAQTPPADGRVMPIPEQYGGGYGAGSTGLAALKDNEMLPTGSGLGMAPSQAYAKDQIGPGIYAPRNQKDVMSLEASDARKAGSQKAIQETIRGHYLRQAQAAALQGGDPAVALDPAVDMGIMTPEEQIQTTLAINSAATEQALGPEPASQRKPLFSSSPKVAQPAPKILPRMQPAYNDFYGESAMKSVGNLFIDFINQFAPK